MEILRYSEMYNLCDKHKIQMCVYFNSLQLHACL